MGNTNLSPCEIKILLGEGSKLKNTFVTKLLGCMTWTSHFASPGLDFPLCKMRRLHWMLVSKLLFQFQSSPSLGAEKILMVTLLV